MPAGRVWVVVLVLQLVLQLALLGGGLPRVVRVLWITAIFHDASVDSALPA